MPIQNNEGLDDPLTFDAQSAFSAGQASYVRSNLISETGATVLQDVDMESNGVLSNRRGFRVLGSPTLASLTGGAVPQGLWWFDSRPYQYLLALVGGNLYRCGSNHAWTLVNSGAATSATLPGYGDQVANKFLVSTADGTGSLRSKYWTAAEIAASGAGTRITDGPLKLSIVTANRYRFWGVNADIPDEVYCSSALFDDGETEPFSIGSVDIAPFRVGSGNGDPVVAIVPWKGLFGLIHLKRESVWMVDTSQTAGSTSAATLTSGFDIQRMSAGVGCVATRSAVSAANDVLFLADDGVRSLARTIQDGDGEVSDPLSMPVHDFIQRVNTAYRHIATGVFWNGQYMLGLPLDSSTVNNCVLVYQPSTNSWRVFTQVQPVAWATASYDNQPRRLVCLDARGNVLEYRDHISMGSATATDHQDNVSGSNIRVPWRARTRGLTCKEPVSPKVWAGVEFEFDRSNAIVDVDVYTDNDSGRRILEKARTGYGHLIMPPDDSPDVWVGEKGNYFVLDCKLGELKVRRIRKGLLDVPRSREVMFEVRESESLTTSEQAESVVVRLRSVVVNGFVDTMEENA